MYWLVLFHLLAVNGVKGLSLAPAQKSILEVSVDCGANVAANSPVINILTDVEISAAAKCQGGDQNFVSDDSVHYNLPAAFTALEGRCLFYRRKNSEHYAVEVEIHYGEQGSLIMTKQKIITAICNFGDYGKDESPQHSIIEGPIAPIEIQTFVGDTVPSSELTLSIQTVDDKDAVSPISLDRRYSVYGTYTGARTGVGLKPVSCEAVSEDGDRYSVLRAGCGDGLIFGKSEGFTTLGTTFRSPYFVGFHLSTSTNLAFDCNVTLCTPSCDGSSCEVFCGTVTISRSNALLSGCTGELYGDTCTFACNAGYNQTGTGISSCGADGIWTSPPIVCTPKNCNEPPPGLNTDISASDTTFGNTASYTCKSGYMTNGGSASLTCLASGNWETGPLQCTPIPTTVPTTTPAPTTGSVCYQYESDMMDGKIVLEMIIHVESSTLLSDAACGYECKERHFPSMSSIDSECWCGVYYSYKHIMPQTSPCQNLDEMRYFSKGVKKFYIYYCHDEPGSEAVNTRQSSGDMSPSDSSARSAISCRDACDSVDKFAFGIYQNQCFCDTQSFAKNTPYIPKSFTTCIQPCENDPTEPCIVPDSYPIFYIV